jgi:4-hydroxy-2-oxoheptanedioate aldolase
MTRKEFLAAPMLAAAAAGVASAAGGNPNYKAKRINRAVELLADKQPIYYGGGSGGYEEGKRLGGPNGTHADYLNYEMEHGPLDFTALRGFMQGLVDAGPTKSGHRTPAVICTLPVLGVSAAHMEANFWVVQQTIACGVHGILLCHARDPEAIKWYVRSCRYPRATPANAVIGEGLLGNGSQGFASRIWGLSTAEYMAKADPWPLNPNGEFMLGIKVEDRHALANAEDVTAVPGLAFAEWGPGDMGISLDLPDGHVGNAQLHPMMREARGRVLAACKKNGLAFLNTVRENDVTDMIDEGVMIGAGARPEVAEKGRKYTNRQMPW